MDLNHKQLAAIGIAALVLGAALYLIVIIFPTTRTYHFTHLNAGWAGYGLNSEHGYLATFINATWSIPETRCNSSQDSAVTVWVGLGGLRDNSVEQIGTGSNCYGGTPTYSAWRELWPLESSQVPIPNFVVAPGQRVSASINYAISSKEIGFYLVAGNESYFYSTSWANSSLSSAEWVVEAPALTNGSRVALANFQVVQFDHGFASIGNLTSRIGEFDGKSVAQLFQITYTCNHTPATQVGPLTQDGGSFSVTWLEGGKCISLILWDWYPVAFIARYAWVPMGRYRAS